LFNFSCMLWDFFLQLSKICRTLPLLTFTGTCMLEKAVIQIGFWIWSAFTSLDILDTPNSFFLYCTVRRFSFRNIWVLVIVLMHPVWDSKHMHWELLETLILLQFWLMYGNDSTTNIGSMLQCSTWILCLHKLVCRELKCCNWVWS